MDYYKIIYTFFCNLKQVLHKRRKGELPEAAVTSQICCMSSILVLAQKQGTAQTR